MKKTGRSEPQYLYLTTRGRRSRKPREIEIWFTRRDGAPPARPLVRAVRQISEKKYGWGDGLLVELAPVQ